jgi:hypothetical protein
LQGVVDFIKLFVKKVDVLVELLALVKDIFGVGQLCDVLHQPFPELVDSLEHTGFVLQQLLDVTARAEDVLHIDPSVLQLDPAFNDCTQQCEVFLHLLGFTSELGSVATGQDHVDVCALRVESLVDVVECGQFLVLILVRS